MSDDQFDKLFKYMERRFDAVDRRFEAVDKRFDSVIGLLDTFIKQTETYHHEMLALGHKVDRHEKWHHQTAKAVGLNLQT